MMFRNKVSGLIGTGAILILTVLLLANGSVLVGTGSAPVVQPSAGESHEILILESPAMKWMGFDPSRIRFDHTAHQESAKMRCEVCHDRIAEEHPDSKFTMSIAHTVCRQCHIPGGQASAHMGCNDCHRQQTEAKPIGGNE